MTFETPTECVQVGAASICAQCGAILIYRRREGRLVLCWPTDEEHARLMSDPKIRAAVDAFTRAWGAS